jgi:prenyltransferase beta subunit
MVFRKEAGRIGKNFIYGYRISNIKRRLERESITRKMVIDSATEYVMTCKAKDNNGFGFTSDSHESDLYSTAYAVSYLGLVGRLDLLTQSNKKNIISYFDSHQDVDGLYRASNLISPTVESGQGWGVMHLLPHIIIALDYLNTKPKKSFNYLYDTFSNYTPKEWVSHIFAQDLLSASNYFMNVVVALQYSRDFMGDVRASDIVIKLNQCINNDLLIKLISSADGLNITRKSELVKTIYHLLPSIIYDGNVPEPLKSVILDLSIQTQNKVGGYGVSILSNACEDIDSIYNIVMLGSQEKSQKTLNSLQEAIEYIPINQNSDGGFVFQRFYPFCYGQCKILSSSKDESNMFATWFRMLSYAFADTVTHDTDRIWNFSKAPGYQWYVK